MEKNKYAPQDKYHKEKTIKFSIRLMKNTEQDIINKLDNVPNKSGYIKQLIRDDIASEKFNQSKKDEV